ncbi:osmotically-inducible lipoprotein OsmE, partial [Escherichia coli]|uniref:osmotically-inducible lipoprotein OsmE n=1 Tax=Escherichia coli TaxID=562 RepID=UPI003EE1F662
MKSLVLGISGGQDSTLAGCTAYDRTKDQFVQPVVKDVKKGMSRAQVAQIAGKPSSEVS